MRAGNSLDMYVKNHELGLEDEKVNLLVNLAPLYGAFDVLLKLI